MRHQHKASTTSNPTSDSGIYNSKSNPSISSPPNSSPPQNSQQSQSTVGITTPTLMVNNSPRQPGPTTGPNQPLQYSTQHFNPHSCNHHPHKLVLCYTQVNHLTHKYHHHTSHNMHLLTALPWAVKLLILQ